MMHQDEPSYHAAAFLRQPGRSFVFALPLRPGDRLAVVGSYPAVAEAATLLGLECVSVIGGGDSADGYPGEVVRHRGDRLPLDSGGFDHVIVPRLRSTLAVARHELARVVRPGGHVFLATDNRWRVPRGPLAVRPRTGRQLLQEAGFADITVYAMRYVTRPHQLVPLGSKAAARWYIRSSYRANTRKEAILARVARMVPVSCGIAMVYQALGFRARRSTEAPT